jgi:hypothetical protein
VTHRAAYYPLTPLVSRLHKHNADVRIGLRQEQNYPPQISLEWLKVRDGITGTKRYFDAIIEPAPESLDDTDLEIFVARGWVALVPSESSQGDLDPTETTANALISYLKEQPRAVVECEQYVKHEPGLGFSKSTVERALSWLVAKGLAQNPNPRGTKARYELTEQGRVYAL